MKKLIIFLMTVCVGFSCTSPSEQLLLAGSGWDQIVIIDKANEKIVWDYPLEKGWECNSVDFDAVGNILFSYKKGARLVTRDKQVCWNIDAPEGCELQTAKVLSDGRYLLAWCGYPATILEVDGKGRILSKTDFDTRIKEPHAQFRQINKTEKGTYLVPLFQSSDLWEITSSGVLVKRIPLEGTPFSTALLPDGNYLVACGDAHSYCVLNLETEAIEQKVTADEVKGVSLSFVAQVLPLENGGLYLCNWQGHESTSSVKDNPRLIELNSAGEIVWRLSDNPAFGSISTVARMP